MLGFGICFRACVLCVLCVRAYGAYVRVLCVRGVCGWQGERQTLAMKVGMFEVSGRDLQQQLAAGDAERAALRAKMGAERNAAAEQRADDLRALEALRSDMGSRVAAERALTVEAKAALSAQEAACRKLALESESAAAAAAREAEQLRARAAELGMQAVGAAAKTQQVIAELEAERDRHEAQRNQAADALAALRAEADQARVVVHQHHAP